MADFAGSGYCDADAQDAVGDGLNVLPADLDGSQCRKLELVWPGKDLVGTVRQGHDGAWELLTGTTELEARSLEGLTSYPFVDAPLSSLAIEGDRLLCLRALRRIMPREVRLAYVDAPRVGVDNQEAAFKGTDSLVYSAWLSVLRTHLIEVRALLRPDGVVVVHVGEAEAALARLVADELFRGQHIGTIVWQRSYAPRNMKGMREFTATHDHLLIYAARKDALPPVGLRKPPEGYSNADGDPRGPWKAEHKGAASRRPNSDFDTYVPPYRWSLASGRLPAGLWRLSPLTGVIWGRPQEAGEFPITVEATDQSGTAIRKDLVIRVASTGQPPALPASIPWLFEEIRTSGPLRVETDDLPVGVAGEEYSAICLAAGGEPFTGPPKRPGAGRYWEFAKDTLVEAYLKDAVHLGRDKPTAIPHPKGYPPPNGELVVENQQTWWPGRLSAKEVFAGYTEDATKHLRALKAIGAIQESAVPAKPEVLLSRLVRIFTDPGDLSLEVFGQAADLAAVSLKLRRRFITLLGTSGRDRSIAASCALPRLRAVVDGVDKDLVTKAKDVKLRADGYLPFEGGGSFATARLSDWIVRRKPDEDLPELNVEAFQGDALLRAVLISQGYLPVPGAAAFGRGFIDESRNAAVLAPSDWMTPERAAQLIASFEPGSSGVLFYFRASPDFDPSALPDGIRAKRIPFELGL